MADTSLLRPAWQLPANVHAFVTTRHGGHSSGDFHSLNLAQHVGDDADSVERNRELLRDALQRQTGVAPQHMQWMQQVHGINVQRVDSPLPTPPVADALYTTQKGIALCVLTADCLPVLFCSADGREIAVAHAGWRGLCNGVLGFTLEQFKCPVAQIRCWMGPAIGPCHFEVGNEVRDAFCMLSRQRDMIATKAAFKPATEPGKWLGSLYEIATVRLRAAGVTDIISDPQCTVCLDDYYSYRQQSKTGRFATGIMRV